MLSDLSDADPALSSTRASLEKAGQTIVRLPEAPPFPGDVDAILAVGDGETLGRAVRFAGSDRPGLPLALVPTTREAQFGFPFPSSPTLVLCDPSLTPGDADRRRAIVEPIRYAVGFDRTIFDLLYTDFDFGALLRRCLTIRCDLVDAEKTDLLDLLGTVIGRAVGRAAGEGLAPEDEIAIGLAAATRYALKTGYCRRDFLSELVGLLTYHGLPNSALVTDEELIAALRNEPRTDGENLLSLPRRLGECGLVPFDPADLVGLLPN